MGVARRFLCIIMAWLLLFFFAACAPRDIEPGLSAPSEANGGAEANDRAEANGDESARQDVTEQPGDSGGNVRNNLVFAPFHRTNNANRYVLRRYRTMIR